MYSEMTKHPAFFVLSYVSHVDWCVTQFQCNSHFCNTPLKCENIKLKDIKL